MRGEGVACPCLEPALLAAKVFRIIETRWCSPLAHTPPAALCTHPTSPPVLCVRVLAPYMHKLNHFSNDRMSL